MTFMKIDQLKAQGPARPPRWLVDQWLKADGTSLWSSKPKVGKTTLLVQLAAAVATGQPFLGRRVEQGLACITLLDRDTIDDTRLRLDALTGGSCEADQHIALARGMESSKPEHAHKHLREMVGDLKPSLLIIDTLGQYLGMETLDKYGEVRARLYEVSVLAEEMNCHIAMTHHDKKRDAASASDRTNGSTAIGGGIEALISIRLGAGNKRTIECSQYRYGNGFEETQLVFDPETQRSKPYGTVTEIHTKTVQTREKDLRTQITAILQVEGSVERSKLMSALQGRNDAKAVMLRKLEAEGVLAVSGTGHRGNPFVYQLATQLQEAA